MCALTNSPECTYDQPSHRRRNPAPQYVEGLEHRVHRAETLLHILIPNLDLTDPGIDAAVAQGWIPGAPGKGDPSQAQAQTQTQAQAQAQEQRRKRPGVKPQANSENKSDTNLESMLRAVAQLDRDEAGNWDYHGHSSGLSFVRRMREELGEIMGPETISTPFVQTKPMPNFSDSPYSASGSPHPGDTSASDAELPPKPTAKEVCRNAVDDAAALLRVVHKPSFWESFERLYSTPPEHYTNEDQKFLPLFHSSMALGHLFGKDEADVEKYETAIEQGLHHFRMARQLMDIADCRDLMGIQSVLMMILFLQSSAKLSQCYAYVGVALRSSCRMGLHRKYNGNFDPVEAQTRKRVFWAVRKMDVYVAAMLGLPLMLSDDQIDQEYPIEVDDEYVTRNGVLAMPEGQVSIMTAFNLHTKLVHILSKIVRCVYPIKVQQDQAGEEEKSYTVPFSTIREIESEMEDWKKSLPAVLNPSVAPERYIRVQQLLRLAYAHAQVMLYRPFLHFVALDKRSGPIDQRAYACAASYVNVSRNIIHITTQMKQKGLLNGAFWFIMYTSFFAILSLVYFAAENPDNITTQAVMQDALEGKAVLASLARRSLAADRCTETLNQVFQRLPEWMRKGQQNPMISRKRNNDSIAESRAGEKVGASRSYPEVHTVGRSGRTQNAPASQSHPDVSTSKQTESIQARAGTFPDPAASNQSQHGMGLAAPYGAWSQPGSLTLGSRNPSNVNTTTEAYPTNSGYMNFDDFSDGTAIGSGLQDYNMPPLDFPNPAINDLSSMIFPTQDEPFSYPSQPLTTFENAQQFAKNSPYINGQQYNTTGMNPHGRIMTPQQNAEDNMEAQFFALPPYMQQRRRQEQQQQHQRQSGTAYPNNFNTQQHIGAPSSTPIFEGWQDSSSQRQQHQTMAESDVTNINIQDLFGGAEWNPMMMMNGFQSQ